MKKHIKQIVAGILLGAIYSAHLGLTAVPLAAQEYRPQRIYRAPQPIRQYAIDWRPQDLTPQRQQVVFYGSQPQLEPEQVQKAEPKIDYPRRYTFAIRPFYFLQHGLKLDFEMELATPGEWLQFELIGHYAGDYEHDDYYYNPYQGWNNEIISGGETYHSLRGLGGAVAYKHMLTKGGWYVSGTVGFNYFDVEYFGTKFTSYVEDGLNYVKREEGLTHRKFYKPEVRFDIGKHFALSRHLFLDAYVGLGYAYSFYEKSRNYAHGYYIDGDWYEDDSYYDSGHRYNYGSYSFGSRGLFFDAGFRIGWLF